MLVQQLIDGLTLESIYALRAMASAWSGLLSPEPRASCSLRSPCR
jgi:hypothetical protein